MVCTTQECCEQRSERVSEHHLNEKGQNGWRQLWWESLLGVCVCGCGGGVECVWQQGHYCAIYSRAGWSWTTTSGTMDSQFPLLLPFPLAFIHSSCVLGPFQLSSCCSQSGNNIMTCSRPSNLETTWRTWGYYWSDILLIQLCQSIVVFTWSVLKPTPCKQQVQRCI